MKKENMKSYPSDLTDRQWKEIESLYTGMRKCKWNKKDYEFSVSSSESMVIISHLHTLLGPVNTK